MNENLMKLRMLVKETNQVIANLKSETQAIEDDNQIVRAEKFERIKNYLIECSEIVKELGVTVNVQIVSNVKYLKYPTTTFIQFKSDAIKRHVKPISFYYRYIDTHGYECSDLGYSSDGIDAKTTWNTESNRKQYFFGCWWKEADEKAFVDNWDQDDFEKKFAAEIERVIIEKANKANAEYEYATNNTRLLKN